MHRSHSKIAINGRKISIDDPVYFIADIAANHDGDLNRAKDLIYLAHEAGAHAAKFQHFTADTIVSNQGFINLGMQLSHQSAWKKSVYEVYQDASINLDWTEELKNTCDAVGIDFFTSPYSLELVDYVDPFVPAYKIGSGDITWLEIIDHISRKNKPVILASGASSLDDVEIALNTVLKNNLNVALLQCNTNYTGSLENFKYVNLNVLKIFALKFPNLILGLSDHTPGHSAVLGAVALGARIIEKHFTDDNSRNGPDHAFSLNPKSWREMVDRTEELYLSLGDGIKRIEDNEVQTSIVQRRAIYLHNHCEAGQILNRNDLTVLRPSPHHGISANFLNDVIGKKIKSYKSKGDLLLWTDLE